MLPELLAAAAAAALPSGACPSCAPGAGGQALPPPQSRPAPPASAPAEARRGQWLAGAGFEWSRLSRGGSGTWRERAGFVAWREAHRALALSTAWRERFGRHDATIELRGDRAWNGASLYLAALATPRADFSERWGLRGGGELALTRRVDLTADARLSHYASGTSASFAPGARLWLAQRRASLRARAIAQRDETGRTRLGWATDVGLDAGPALHLTAALARYPETDAGVTRRTRALSAGAAWQASETLTVRANLAREDRARSYRRDGASVSLAFAF